MKLETTSPGEPARRSRSEATADRIAVRRALSGVSLLMGPLQGEAARLRALVSRSGQREELVPLIVCLGVRVEEVASILEAAVAALPPRQQEQGQVTDLTTSLAQLEQTIPRLPHS